MVNRLPDFVTIIDYSGAFMYILTMPTNMIASFLCGYTAIGLFIGKKQNLVRITGLAGVFLAISAGFPVAIYSRFFAGSGPISPCSSWVQLLVFW